MRPGPLAVCPSARPRGQASSPSPPLPASGLSLPPTPAVPSPRAYLCRASPRRQRGAGRPAGKGEGASSSAPTRLPAAGARPRVSLLRLSPGGRGPGRHRLALPGSRPLPRPARSHCRGARTCSRRAGLHGGGRGSWRLQGGGTREGAGAGDR